MTHTPTELERAMRWLIGGRTGLSSTAILAHMLGGAALGELNHPHDPSDFSRCARLLMEVPEWTPRMPEMACHGPYWAALAPRWAEVTACMEAEVGLLWEKGRKAQRTYDLMRAILDPAQDADPRVVVLGKGMTMRTGA